MPQATGQQLQQIAMTRYMAVHQSYDMGDFKTKESLVVLQVSG